MFMLCAFADKMYWASCIEPLLYPKGCSFYRPFSYREDYISPSLLSVFKDINQLEKLLPIESWNNGIFCIRFRDESEPKYRGIFIPLRLITLTNVNVTDTIQVNFRLGGYVRLSPQRKLRAFSLDGIVDYKKEEYMLLIDIPPNKTERINSLEYQPDFPAGLWDSLAEDESLSPIAKENFTGTAVLRLVQISERGEITPLSPKLIRKDKKDLGVYGFELRSGNLYDFDFAYSRIIAPKESIQQIQFDYSFNSPIAHLDVSRDRIVITGNYRREPIWIRPKVGLPGPTFLEWIGMNKTEKGIAADPSRDKILDFRLPVKLLYRFWSRERIINSVLTVTFLVLSGVFFYLAIKSHIPQIFIALCAFSAGLFGSSLKDFLIKRA